MQPPAHRPPTPAQLEAWRLTGIELKLFHDNFSLILAHEIDILKCDEYFFCRPRFTHYGIMSNAYMNVGTLLLGWRHGILIDRCRVCAGNCKSYVYTFGGLLSGSGWAGLCTTCQGSKFVLDSRLTFARWDFAGSSAKQFKDRYEEVEEFHTVKYSFGAEPLVPDVRNRKVTRKLVEAVTLAELIEALKSRKIRKPTDEGKTLLREYSEIEHPKHRGPAEKMRVISLTRCLRTLVAWKRQANQQEV